MEKAGFLSGTMIGPEAEALTVGFVSGFLHAFTEEGDVGEYFLALNGFQVAQ